MENPPVTVIITWKIWVVKGQKLPVIDRWPVLICSSVTKCLQTAKSLISFVKILVKLFCSIYWQNLQITAAVHYFHYNSHHHYHYHHFHYHWKMQLYYLRILITIPLDSNIIPCQFQLNFAFFLLAYIFL